MDHRRNQFIDFTQGTTEQAEIITFWAHYAKTWLSLEICNAGKDGKTGKRTTTSNIDRLSARDIGCITGKHEGLDWTQIILETLTW